MKEKDSFIQNTALILGLGQHLETVVKMDVHLDIDEFICC